MWLPNGLKQSQNGPTKIAQKDAKTAPKKAPRWLQDGQTWPQDGLLGSTVHVHIDAHVHNCSKHSTVHRQPALYRPAAATAAITTSTATVTATATATATATTSAIAIAIDSAAAIALQLLSNLGAPQGYKVFS